MGVNYIDSCVTVCSEDIAMSALFRLYHSEGGEWVMRLVEDTSLQQILYLHYMQVHVVL